MKTLDELMIDSGSDKATVFTRTYAKPKGFAPHYDRLFSHLRDQPINLVEIGVGGGESIRAWLDYFPKAHIFGVDIVANTNIFNTEGDAIERYTFMHGDQSMPSFWEEFLSEHGGGLSIVCDDGSHISKDIFTTWNALWPEVKSGGFYAIEDLNTSYGGAGSHFTPAGCLTQMEWIKQYLDVINQTQSAIDWLQFSQELVVFCRK